MLQMTSCKAVLPTVLMDESLSFYRDLGFREEAHSDDVTELSNDDVAFYLKAVSPGTRLAPPVMRVTVPSLSEWWIRVKLLDLGRYHRVKPPREPVAEPWGRTIGFLYDPDGTTWQFAESRDVAWDRRGARRATSKSSSGANAAKVHFDADRQRFFIT